MDGKRRVTPEERELERKKLVLDELQKQVVERELELETALGGLLAFEKKYQEATGERYAMLDELHFRIAQLRAAQQPEQPAAQVAAKAAASARGYSGARKPRSTAPRSDQERKPPPPPRPTPAFHPSEDLKRLYREVAKAMHPDFANDDVERNHRHVFMSRANAAYEADDHQKLLEVLLDWEHSPESVRGQDSGAELIRTIRKVARCEQRLEQIKTHMAKVETHGMFGIKLLAEEADKLERDFLSEMTARLDEEIEGAKALLLRMGGKVPDPSELQRADEGPPEEAFMSPDA